MGGVGVIWGETGRWPIPSCRYIQSDVAGIFRAPVIWRLVVRSCQVFNFALKRGGGAARLRTFDQAPEAPNDIC